jgi:hypothetical protein
MVTENRTLARRAAITLREWNAESARGTISPAGVHCVARTAFVVAMASATSDPAPRAEPALPARSWVAAITGAASGVLIVAIKGL